MRRFVLKNKALHRTIKSHRVNGCIVERKPFFWYNGLIMPYLNMIQKKTQKTAGRKTIPLKKLIAESLTLERYPEIKTRILAELTSYSKEKKSEIRAILMEEKTHLDEINEEEGKEKMKLIDALEHGLRSYKKQKTRVDLKKREETERSSEEKFAKELLKKLDSSE